MPSNLWWLFYWLCHALNRVQKALLSFLHILVPNGLPMKISLSKSILSIIPLQAQFPSVSIHYLVDIFSIFWFKPMHCLWLGVSKLLNQFFVSHVKDETRFGTVMTTGKITLETLSPKQRTFLLEIHQFLIDEERFLSAFSLKPDCLEE